MKRLLLASTLLCGMTLGAAQATIVNGTFAGSVQAVGEIAQLPSIDDIGLFPRFEPGDAITSTFQLDTTGFTADTGLSTSTLRDATYSSALTITFTLADHTYVVLATSFGIVEYSWGASEYDFAISSFADSTNSVGPWLLLTVNSPTPFFADGQLDQTISITSLVKCLSSSNRDPLPLRLI